MEKAIQGDLTDPAAPSPRKQRKTISCRTKAPPPSLAKFLSVLHATGTRLVLLIWYPGYADQYKDPISPAVLPPSLKLSRNKKCDSISQTELSAHWDIVKSKANVTKDQADKIERETRDQHKY